MQENSRHRAKIAMPIMVFILSFTVMLFTIYKGAKGIGLNKTSPLVSVLSSACVSIVAALLSYPIMIRHVKRLEEQDAAEASKTEEGKEGTPPAATEISDEPEKPRKAVCDPKTESMFRALVMVCAAFRALRMVPKTWQTRWAPLLPSWPQGRESWERRPRSTSGCSSWQAASSSSALRRTA